MFLNLNKCNYDVSLMRSQEMCCCWCSCGWWSARPWLSTQTPSTASPQATSNSSIVAKKLAFFSLICVVLLCGLLRDQTISNCLQFWNEQGMKAGKSFIRYLNGINYELASVIVHNKMPILEWGLQTGSLH